MDYELATPAQQRIHDTQVDTYQKAKAEGLSDLDALKAAMRAALALPSTAPKAKRGKRR
jgi:hypothetical protein